MHSVAPPTPPTPPTPSTLSLFWCPRCGYASPATAHDNPSPASPSPYHRTPDTDYLCTASAHALQRVYYTLAAPSAASTPSTAPAADLLRF